MTTAETIGGLAVRHPRTLDEPILRLLRAQNVCVINTLGGNDVIHSRVVWVDTDGTDVLVNSVAGRVWVRDLERNPNVTCTVTNLSNPYEFVSIEGRLVERCSEGADAHIDVLAEKYLGLERYPFHDEAAPRLQFRIRPERILHMAPEDLVVGASSEPDAENTASPTRDAATGRITSHQEDQHGSRDNVDEQRRRD